VPGLGDHEVTAASPHVPCLAQDRGDVVARLLEATFGLRDDLLGDYENVVRLEPACPLDRVPEEPCQVDAGLDLR
jgi:hypothetical protein